MKSTRVAGTVLAAALTVLAAAVLVFASPNGTAGSDDLGVTLAGCVPDSVRQSGKPPAVVEECITDVLAAALIADRTDEVLPELARLEAASVDICHSASHLASARLFSDPARWRDLIDRVNVRTCSSGLLHGAMDAIATLQWDLTAWTPLAQWCSDQPRGEVVPDCAHAIGHAAWDMYKNRVDAAEVCALLGPPEWKVDCGDGVVMQEFRPATRPEVVPLSTVSSLGSVCSHVDAADEPDVRVGCARGVGFLLFHEGRERLINSGVELTPEAVGVEVVRSVELCAGLGSDARHCAARFFFMAVYASSYLMDDPQDKVCILVPEFERECRVEAEAVERILASFPPSNDPGSLFSG